MTALRTAGPTRPGPTQTLWRQRGLCPRRKTEPRRAFPPGPGPRAPLPRYPLRPLRPTAQSEASGRDPAQPWPSCSPRARPGPRPLTPPTATARGSPRAGALRASRKLSPAAAWRVLRGPEVSPWDVLHLSHTAPPPPAPSLPRPGSGQGWHRGRTLAGWKTSGPIVRTCRVPTPPRGHSGLRQSTARHPENRTLRFCSRVSALRGAGPHEATREASGVAPLKEADQRANT